MERPETTRNDPKQPETTQNIRKLGTFMRQIMKKTMETNKINTVHLSTSKVLSILGPKLPKMTGIIKSSKISVTIVFSMIYLINVPSFIEFLGLKLLKIGTEGFL